MRTSCDLYCNKSVTVSNKAYYCKNYHITHTVIDTL